jgi:4-hydroxy-2-oxoglutarate aldolase
VENKEGRQAMNQKLAGIIIPAATPFDDQGYLSVEMLEHNITKWNATNVRGYMCLGSNGEFRSLSDDESITVVRQVMRLKADKTLIVGVGRESLHLTLAFLDRVTDLGPGIDYVSVLTPNYFAKLMDDEALVDFYRAVADHSSLPVLLYVAPGFANSVVLSPRAVRVLADHPNIHGLKDTTPAMMVDYMLSVGGREDFSVLAGSLNMLLTCLMLGGSGGVVSAANYFPAQCAEVTDLYFSGEHQEAVDRYLRLQRLVKQTGARRGVAGLKCCMNLCGFSGGKPRLPVKALAAQEESDIRAILSQTGSALCVRLS